MSYLNTLDARVARLTIEHSFKQLQNVFQIPAGQPRRGEAKGTSNA